MVLKKKQNNENRIKNNEEKYECKRERSMRCSTQKHRLGKICRGSLALSH